MKKIICIFLLAYSGFFSFLLIAQNQLEATTIYLLRHAETIFPPYQETPPNPQLRDLGKERANLLARMLQAENITHIFSTDYLRTKSTVEPLAKAKKQSIQFYNPDNLAAFAEKLKTLKGKIVVVGHSNTTPQLVELLGGDAGSRLRNQYDFNRLYVLQMSPNSPTHTAQLRYGIEHEPLKDFKEGFENGLAQWELNNPEKIRIVDSKDPTHGKVLEMHVGGPNTFALIKGSENWKGVVIEGEVLFPEETHNYLGFIYNYQVKDIRADYGCIYIKGNSSYVRVNPHRDGHVSRILYDEFRTQLTGEDTIIAGKWQHFKAEIIGNTCHFYVGDMETPKVTFPFLELNAGKIGFEPRVIGSQVWIDNIHAKSIESFSYRGFQPTGIRYAKEKFLTDWQVIGPFRQPMEAIEKDGFIADKKYEAHLTPYQWQPFETDNRGCVVGGKVIEWTSLKTHAYFHTNIPVASSRKATLHFSTTNDLVVWLNGKKVGDIEGKFKAWYDCLDNPNHAGQQLDIDLQTGNNTLLILEKGMGWNRYAGDGFFVGLVTEAQALADWQNSFNKGQFIKSLYLPNALSVNSQGMVFSGLPAIEQQYQLLKNQVVTVQSSKTLKKVAARPDIDYEIGQFTDAEGSTYKYLIIWRKQNGQTFRELEIIDKADVKTNSIKEIDQARQEWMALCNQHNAQQLVRQKYTSNAAYYNHRPVIMGTDAIAEEYSYMNRPNYSLTLTPILVEPVNQRIAFEVGQCSGSYGGKYMLVWEKTKDGEWKVLFDSNY